jgi:hypothetical protein
MVAVTVGATPSQIAVVHSPAQIFIQNQSGSAATVLPENGSGGTQLNNGDTLIMGFQDPIVPEIRVFGTGNGILDVEIWPY